MKTKVEKRAKAQRIKEKLSIRAIWKTTPKEKKGATWEFELFKKIAEERKNMFDKVIAKHITPDWKIIDKFIHIDDLTHWNFDHTIPKSRGKENRLDLDNIQIVSAAWHFYKTNKQILKVDYPN